MNSIFSRWPDRWAFRAGVRRRIWKRLAAQIKHGMPLDQALRLQRDRSAAKPAGRVFSAIYAAIDSGHPLRIALEPFAPVNEVLLISSGQKAGNLPEGFVMATEIIDAVEKLRRAVIRATAMPLLLFFLTLLLLVVVALYMIPEFSLLTDPKKWQGSAKTIYVISNFIASPWGALTISLLALSPFALFFSFPRWTGRLRTRLDQFPPFSIYRLIVGSVWMFSVATFMRAGMPIRDILDSMLSSRLSPWLRERVTAISEIYDTGKNLGESMQLAGFNFPDSELIDDLLVYATLPEFDEHLYGMSKDWLKDGVETVEEQAMVINVVCTILIILLISAVVISMNALQQEPTSSFGGM